MTGVQTCALPISSRSPTSASQITFYHFLYAGGRKSSQPCPHDPNFRRISQKNTPGNPRRTQPAGFALGAPANEKPNRSSPRVQLPVRSGNLLHATISLLFYFISPPSLSSSPNNPAPGLHVKSLTPLLWVRTRLENRLPTGLKSPPAPPQTIDFAPAKRPGGHQRLELL